MKLLLLTSAILLRIFSNSFSNVFQKKLTLNKQSPYSVNFITYVILSIFCLPLIPALNLRMLPADFWIYAILGGIFGAIGNSFLIKALEKGELSVLGPINAYKSVIGILFGIILLKEFPSIYGILGILLIIIGSYFVFDTVDEKFSLSLFKRKDIRYRFYALFFTAIEAVLIKRVILESNILTACIATCIFGALFSYSIMKYYKIKIDKTTTKDSFLYLVTAFCFGSVMITTAYIFSKMNVGYALSLFQLSILLNVILGYKIFKEQHLLKKLTGAVIAILGSIIIILN